jgi:hypothetical protein
MRIPHGFAAWAMALTLPALAACTGQPALPTAPPSPVPTKRAVTTTPPATLPPQATPLPCFTRADLAAMTLQEIAAQPSLCFDSEDGVQTEIAQAEQVEVIRAFLQNPTRRDGLRSGRHHGQFPQRRAARGALRR